MANKDHKTSEKKAVVKVNFKMQTLKKLSCEIKQLNKGIQQ